VSAEALRARLVTIADEAFGLNPVEPTETTVRRIEHGIHKLLVTNADLHARIERADRMLALEDARPVAERVLEMMRALAPTERGALLEQLAREHRQAAPGAVASDRGAG